MAFRPPHIKRSGALGWNESSPHTSPNWCWIGALRLRRLLDGDPYIRPVVARALDRVALLLPTVMEVVAAPSDRRSLAGPIFDPVRDGWCSHAARAELPARWICRTLVVSAAAAQVLTLWNTIRRYTVGLDGSLTFRHANWMPLLNPWLLLVINTVAIGWLAGSRCPSHRIPPHLRQLLDRPRFWALTLTTTSCCWEWATIESGR